jgi:hypothetical protein
METISKNPSLILSNTYNDLVLEIRLNIKNKLGAISKDCMQCFEDFIWAKIDARSTSHLPALGELYPWLINDLVNGQVKRTSKVAVAWYAYYYHCLMLDELMDNDSCRNSPIYSITSALLAKYGLTEMLCISSSLQYQTNICESVDMAFTQQMIEIEHRKDIWASLELRKECSVGKNRLIYFCAHALAEVYPNNQILIFELTHALLGIAQYLDDLLDYEEDFERGNITVLFHEFAKSGLLKDSNSNSILELLIASGQLQEYLLLIRNKVEKISSVICKIDQSSNSLGRIFIEQLHARVNEFISILSNQPNKIDEYYLSKIREQIQVVGQLT